MRRSLRSLLALKSNQKLFNEAISNRSPEGKDGCNRIRTRYKHSVFHLMMGSSQLSWEPQIVDEVISLAYAEMLCPPMAGFLRLE